MNLRKLILPLIAVGALLCGLVPALSAQPGVVWQNVAVCDPNFPNNCFSPPAGNAITPVVSTAAESGHVLKTASGNLWGVTVTTAATPGYLMTFNAVAVPGDGAVTPINCVAVAANTTVSISFAGGPAEAFSTGISVAFSSTGCATKTASATAWFTGLVQ